MVVRCGGERKVAQVEDQDGACSERKVRKEGRKAGMRMSRGRAGEQPPSDGKLTRRTVAAYISATPPTEPRFSELVFSPLNVLPACFAKSLHGCLVLSVSHKTSATSTPIPLHGNVLHISMIGSLAQIQRPTMTVADECFSRHISRALFFRLAHSWLQIGS